MKKITAIWSFVLTALLTAGPLASQSTVSQSPDLKIKEWPRNLRTDLKGTSIKLVLPENALDRPWDDALIAKFQQLTGITVQTVRPGNDTTAVLANYLRDFGSGSPDGDVYAIDIVWPGILATHAEDLLPTLGGLHDMLPALVQNDTVNGKLIAVPYFIEVSLLYYRSDLLQKYHFTQPPRTWNELEHQARTIQDGERLNGKKSLWGFLWQGAASEALTCNALERSRKWIGTISPPETTDQLEDDSLQIWKRGDAVFMRNWPYAYLESMSGDSNIKGLAGVTVLPMGDGPDGRHADILGGFQLMVSKTSKNKSAAIELVKFLTSSEIQRVNAITRGYAPTRPSLYNDSRVLKANPFFGTLRHVLLEGAATRPSTAAGPRYDAVSRAYFTAVRQVLTGHETPEGVVEDLQKRLRQILSE